MAAVETDAMTVSGVRLIAENDMVIRAHNGREGGFEPETLARWKELAATANGGTMLDVGCYTGIYAIAAALQGAHVVAFEPNSEAAARARKNFRLNGVDPVLHDCALWSRTEPLRLFKERPLTSASSVVSRKGSACAVMGYPLDSFVFCNVHAIKIDAERAEPAILRGGFKTIEQYKPEILIEVLDGPAAIAAILEPLGYKGERCGAAMMSWRA